jgi:hypothetical protein
MTYPIANLLIRKGYCSHIVLNNLTILYFLEKKLLHKKFNGCKVDNFLIFLDLELILTTKKFYI